MWRALVAGGLYFVVIFALGFVLGVIRTIYLVPMLGPVVAVIVELPIILTAAWFACRVIVRQFRVPPKASDRLAMGAIAFLWLMIGEIGVLVSIEGKDILNFFTLFQLPENRIGLAGQILFALFPLIQIWQDCYRDRINGRSSRI